MFVSIYYIVIFRALRVPKRFCNIPSKFATTATTSTTSYSPICPFENEGNTMFSLISKSIIISECECLLFSNMLAVSRILYSRFLEMVSIFEDTEASRQKMLMFVVNGRNVKLKVVLSRLCMSKNGCFRSCTNLETHFTRNPTFKISHVHPKFERI